jgi:hypothetical protein
MKEKIYIRNKPIGTCINPDHKPFKELFDFGIVESDNNCTEEENGNCFNYAFNHGSSYAKTGRHAIMPLEFAGKAMKKMYEIKIKTTYCQDAGKETKTLKIKVVDPKFSEN